MVHFFIVKVLIASLLTAECTVLHHYISLYSAGVGRTGTYIALDYLLDQAAKENVVDMFECTKEMRARRPCMIQAEVGLKACNNSRK